MASDRGMCLSEQPPLIVATQCQCMDQVRQAPWVMTCVSAQERGEAALQSAPREACGAGMT